MPLTPEQYDEYNYLRKQIRKFQSEIPGAPNSTRIALEEAIASMTKQMEDLEAMAESGSGGRKPYIPVADRVSQLPPPPRPRRNRAPVPPPSLPSSSLPFPPPLSPSMTATEAAEALAKQASSPGQPFLPGSSAGDFNRSLQPKFTQLMPQSPVAHQMTAAEVAAYQAANPQAAAATSPKPPPVPPHIAMLSAALEQSMERGNELRDFLRQNPGMGGSLAAKGLRGAMTAQDTFISNQFAGLSPAEQQTQMPAMQALDQQRKQIEEEELKRRKQFTEEAKHGSGVLSHFNMGMAVAGGAIGSVVNRALALGGAANPASASTFQTSRKILEGSVGQSIGVPTWLRQWSRIFQGTADRLNEESRSGSVFAQLLRGIGDPMHGFKIPGVDDSKFRENLFMPMKTRITTGEEYEQGLANAALESSGESADLKLLQEQMRNSNMLLREIARNTGGSNSPLFGN